jgi:hypothetical protein
MLLLIQNHPVFRHSGQAQRRSGIHASQFGLLKLVQNKCRPKRTRIDLTKTSGMDSGSALRLSGMTKSRGFFPAIAKIEALS